VTGKEDVVSRIDPDEVTSVFEDLDEPSPPVDQRKLQRREVLLGLCLLVLVAALGLGYWQQEESQQAAYRAGEAAALAHHWDEARTHFLAAGDYPNAKARVAQAVTQIAERDKQYQAVLTALAKYDGVSALQALDALDKIETGYGGADLLRSEANLQIYRSALQGVVARRSTANPPGLYYRTATDWAWLQGSDPVSSIHNLGNTDYMVYDVPVADGVGRRLMVASLNDGSLTFTPVALDPATNVFWGAHGGWTYTYGCSGTVPPTLRSYYCAEGMVYTAAGSTVTETITLPDPQWVVLDLARDGSKLLVADLSQANAATPQLRLYVTAPDGSDPHLLYQGANWVERAAFSPDGRSVLVALGSTDPDQGTLYTALLLDAVGQAPPYLLSSVRPLSAATPADIDFVLLAGAGTGRVALAQSIGQLMQLTIVDLDTARQGRPLNWISHSFLGSLLVTRMDDGGVLACGQLAKVSITLDRLSADSAACVQLDPAGRETAFDLPPVARYSIGYAWPRQGTVIFPVTLPGSGATSLSVLRVTAARPGAVAPLPTVILQLSLGMGEALNLVPGSSLLAYARQGQLHVRSYDGSFDLLLEQDVDALYDLRGTAAIAGLF
jgi:hypothetical protein